MTGVQTCALPICGTDRDDPVAADQHGPAGVQARIDTVEKPGWPKQYVLGRGGPGENQKEQGDQEAHGKRLMHGLTGRRTNK